uniref:GLOBIN domain-containing protein n=1 Tax=Steinernema glaseri TaxID=37863 RepID=A0A1I7YTI4_9BILA
MQGGRKVEIIFSASELLEEDDEQIMKPLKELNDAERTLLRQSWDIIKRDMERIAVKIFEMIFEQAPEAKQMFPFMKMDYAENEKPKDEFTFHALRFIQVLESVIWTVDDVDNLDPILSNLGKMHARLEEQLGFKTYYWSVFRECTLHHFRRCIKSFTSSSRPAKSDMHVFTETELDNVIILWRIVIDDVVSKMKSSFFDNLKHRKANREFIDEEHQHHGNGERALGYAGRGKNSVQDRQLLTNGINGNSTQLEHGKTEANGLCSNGATPIGSRIHSPMAWIRRRIHLPSPKPERSEKVAESAPLQKA